MGEVDYVVQLEIICVPCNDEVKSFFVFGADDVESLVDMIQEEGLLPGVWLAIHTAYCNLLDSAIISCVFWRY